jgi:NADH-quinone oxidoreductase subunit G
VYIVGADPAGDSAELKEAIQRAGFVVVQELFMTETARNANVILPAQAPTEREGSLVSGERRVQRFSQAVPPLGQSRADFEITCAIAENMGLKLNAASAGSVFASLAAAEQAFSGLDYTKLSLSAGQWPVTGRADAYFSGTVEENKDGLGVTLPPMVAGSPAPIPVAMPPAVKVDKDSWLAVPVNRLYDRGITLRASTLLNQRIGTCVFSLHPADAEKLGIGAGANLLMTLGEQQVEGTVDLDSRQPEGVVLVRRSMGLSLTQPAEVRLQAIAVHETENG